MTGLEDAIDDQGANDSGTIEPASPHLAREGGRNPALRKGRTPSRNPSISSSTHQAAEDELRPWAENFKTKHTQEISIRHRTLVGATMHQGCSPSQLPLLRSRMVVRGDRVTLSQSCRAHNSQVREHQNNRQSLDVTCPLLTLALSDYRDILNLPLEQTDCHHGHASCSASLKASIVSAFSAEPGSKQTPAKRLPMLDVGFPVCLPALEGCSSQHAGIAAPIQGHRNSGACRLLYS